MCRPGRPARGPAPDTLFDTVEETWGPVDVLVANAGAGVSARVHKTTDEDWQRMLDLNLTAPFRCMRRALPRMLDAVARPRRRGRVASRPRSGEPYIAAYTASKHGVLGLVRSAAAEVAEPGVTVNAICPGYVDTPMTDATVAGIVAKTGRSEAEARQILADKQPNGRLVTPEEVAAAVWFCVDNASINGQGINVDGGAHQSVSQMNIERINPSSLRHAAWLLARRRRRGTDRVPGRADRARHRRAGRRRWHGRAVRAGAGATSWWRSRRPAGSPISWHR